MIKIIYPNLEMFMGSFQYGLREGHFNELLAQKPSFSLAEVVTRAKCYINGE